MQSSLACPHGCPASCSMICTLHLETFSSFFLQLTDYQQQQWRLRCPQTFISEEMANPQL